MDPERHRSSAAAGISAFRLLPLFFLALALLIPAARVFLQEKPPPVGRFPPAEHGIPAVTGSGPESEMPSSSAAADRTQPEESSPAVLETLAPSSSAPLPSAAETAHVHSWQPVFQTVRHEAVTHVVHHEAETHTVHHDALTHVIRHEAETHTVFHEAETHTVHHEETGHWELFERHSICSVCGLDLSIEYLEGRLPEIGIHSLDAHDGAAGWHSEWVAVDRFHPGGSSDAYRQDWITDSPAWDETVTDREAWEEIVTDREAWEETIVDREAWDETITDREAWDETVTDREAWDETVIIRYRCEGCGETKEP